MCYACICVCVFVLRNIKINAILSLNIVLREPFIPKNLQTSGFIRSYCKQLVPLCCFFRQYFFIQATGIFLIEIRTLTSTYKTGGFELEEQAVRQEGRVAVCRRIYAFWRPIIIPPGLKSPSHAIVSSLNNPALLMIFICTKILLCNIRNIVKKSLTDNCYYLPSQSLAFAQKIFYNPLFFYLLTAYIIVPTLLACLPIKQ